MSKSPIKKHYTPHSIRFLKKSIPSSQDQYTIINDFQKKEPFSYRQYLQAINVWEKQKLKRQIRVQSLASTINAYRTVPQEKVITAALPFDSKTTSETINHDAFLFQGCKRAIYRLKLNKNIESIKRKRQQVGPQSNSNDLNIMKKTISSRQQKQCIKESFGEKSFISNSTFYLLRGRSKSIDNQSKLSKDFEPLQSINYISPW